MFQAAHAGTQARQNAQVNSVTRASHVSRGVDKGKRHIDSDGFQVVSARKTFRPKPHSSGYSSLNIFDLLQDMPSPESMIAIEEACNTAEKLKRGEDQPAINLEVNMSDSDDSSPRVNSTQMVPNSP